MIKKIPYITAALITMLWIVLQIHTGNSMYDLVDGLAGIAALLLFVTAWKFGKDSEKPFAFAILLSLAGLYCPIIAKLIQSGETELEALEPLLYLFPIIPACIIGHFTRTHNRFVAVGTVLNAIPGILFCGLFIIALVFDAVSEPEYSYTDLKSIAPLVVFVLVTLLSAFTEAHADKTKRRALQRNCWWFFILLVLVIGIRNTDACYNFGTYAYDAFIPVLRMCMPLIFWQLKNWLEEKQKNHTAQTISYFGLAFIFNILQAGVFYYLMNGLPISIYFMDGIFPVRISIEWMLIGTVMALVVYWQKPRKASAAGIVSGLVFTLVNTGFLFAKSENLREIVYDLGGPAVDIDLSTRFDLIGYRLNTIKDFVSGNIWAFVIVLLLLALTVATAIFLVKCAENHNAANVTAISFVLQAVIFTVERISITDCKFELAFAGAYLVAFVLMWRVLRPTTVSDETTCATEQKASIGTTGIKIATAILLVVAVLGDFGFLLGCNTDITKTVLESYQVTVEDAAEWDTAADQIVQIIADQEPYYVAENRTHLSTDDAAKWAEEGTQFVDEFLGSNLMHPTNAREIAGQYYIKCSVAHALLGDDTDYDNDFYSYGDGYIPYARLSKLYVKLLKTDLDSLSVNLNGWEGFISLKEFTEEEEETRKELYQQVADDYPEFFNEYDEPVLRYCFADAILTLQDYASVKRFLFAPILSKVVHCIEK